MSEKDGTDRQTEGQTPDAGLHLLLLFIRGFVPIDSSNLNGRPTDY